MLRDDGISTVEYAEQLTYLTLLKMAHERATRKIKPMMIVADIKSGADQYFTPRVLIDAMVGCVQPTVRDTVCDPACGTGGFLLWAHAYAAQDAENLTPDDRAHLQENFIRGTELVDGPCHG